MSEAKTYDLPATFVNVKRVKSGEKDSKGRDVVKLTFGTGEDRQGNATNGCDQLIAALEQYRGKQVNLDIRIGEAEANGRKFPTAFVRVVEMIPKDDARSGAVRTEFVPKVSKTEATKQRSEDIRAKFGNKA